MATNIPSQLKRVDWGNYHDYWESWSNAGDLLKCIKGLIFLPWKNSWPKRNQELFWNRRGSIRLQGKGHIEEEKHHNVYVIDELPYQVNKAELIKKIAELAKDKKLEGITDLRDESDRDGIR